MDLTFLVKLLSEQSLLGLVQLLIGNKLKSVEGFANKYINIVNLLVGLIGFQLMPASAHAASLSGLAPAVSPFLGAIVQNLLVTGTHSTFKNTVLPVLKDAMLALMGMLVKKTG